MAQQKRIQIGTMRLQVQSLASLKDLVLPWLWHRLATLASISPLAWEPPRARGAALKSKKKKKKKIVYPLDPNTDLGVLLT